MLDILRPCSNPKKPKNPEIEICSFTLVFTTETRYSKLCRGMCFHTFSDLPISSGFYMSFQNIFRRFPWLVVSTILKNMKVKLGRIIPYMKWKIKAMFQTTNQLQLKPPTRSGFPIAMFETTSNSVFRLYLMKYIP